MAEDRVSLTRALQPDCDGNGLFLMATVLRRDSSVSNTVPDNEEEEEDDDEEEGTHEGTELTDNAEGTLAWERASATKRGPKKKKKKSEGASVQTGARCLSAHVIMAPFSLHVDTLCIINSAPLMCIAFLQPNTASVCLQLMQDD